MCACYIESRECQAHKFFLWKYKIHLKYVTKLRKLMKWNDISHSKAKKNTTQCLYKMLTRNLFFFQFYYQKKKKCKNFKRWLFALTFKISMKKCPWKNERFRDLWLQRRMVSFTKLNAIDIRRQSLKSSAFSSRNVDEIQFFCCFCAVSFFEHKIKAFSLIYLVSQSINNQKKLI